jgi:hypothetical protein
MATNPPLTTLSRPLSELDPDVAAAVDAELHRRQSTLEMIASENFAPAPVTEAQGSVLTNKYAEGYPGRRYYGGCGHVDVVEQPAIARVRELFGAEAANVQPRSGAQANAAAMFALLKPGDTILGLGLGLAHGGHLTHGMRINLSGKLYNVVPYHVRESDMRVDMDEVERLALAHRPKMIVAGWSAYPRRPDFAAFRRIADAVGAYLLVDMAHFAGLVAAGLHPSPVPYADVVTTTTHKTLGGPRGGVILSRADLAKKINSAVFPGRQGRPGNGLGRSPTASRAWEVPPGPRRTRPRGGDTRPVRGPIPGGPRGRRPLWTLPCAIWQVGTARGDGEALNHHSGGAGAPHADAVPGVPDRRITSARSDQGSASRQADDHTIGLTRSYVLPGNQLSPHLNGDAA